MADQLTGRIEEYLKGKLSLDDVTRWLLANLQLILDSGDREAIRLANAVDTELIRLSEGLVTQQELDDRFRSLAREQTTIRVEESFDIAAVVSVAATGSLTVWAFPENLTPVEDLRLQYQVA